MDTGVAVAFKKRWPRVKRILQEIGEGTEVTLVVFEQFVRAKA